MKYLKITTILIVTILLMQSCSIEKRRHRKGYHVEWNKNISAKKFQKKSNNTFMKKEALKPTTIEQVKVFKEQKVLLNEQSKIKLEANKLNTSQVASKSIEISIVSKSNLKEKELKSQLAFNNIISQQLSPKSSSHINEVNFDNENIFPDSSWLITLLWVVVVLLIILLLLSVFAPI